ncbi:TIM barrel protein [Roseivivax sp. GX 12232]|uniref:sugar phosphate isomerase/epimerase family protein n=1 Tax=Roseivivax sp. GX 12232 TaxID=2900547 RepID=UPI001E4AE2AF|nr:TIM barrel protein [Roseivivax sp. GX 12232]MCE0506158.1 TIM barrel protein [Roseivivax sp. GX 12232]
MFPLALHQLCLRDTGPLDLPGIARGAGLDRVSVFVIPPAPNLDIFPRLTAQDLAAFRTTCAAHAVTVHNIEVFSITPETEVAEFTPALDLGAEIGAQRLTALVQDPEAGRAGARLAELADAAAARGMAVSLEFMKFSQCRSIGAGEELLRAIGHENLSLLVDPLHLFRTGGTVADLAATDPALIGAAQLCDGPLTAPESPFAEAVEDRGLPGEGAFPLAAFLAALPPKVPLDLEVPMQRLARAGLSPGERAERLVAASRAVLEAAAPAGA